MTSYVIEVQRTGASTGMLTFKVGGSAQFKVRCFENAGQRINAGTYTSCSTTTMATKGFKAVYLPDEQTGRRGIFIHQGSKPSHSMGCIVCARDKVEEIWNEVPANKRNVTVVVRD